MLRAPGLVYRLVIAGLILAILTAAGVLIAVVTLRRIPVEELAPDLFVLEGRGANTVVLATAEGLMVVDTKFWKFAELLRDRIGGLSDKPVRYVINTHHHWDHVDGNLLFPIEATFVSTANAFRHFRLQDPAKWSAPGAVDHLPKAGFEEKDHQIKLAGQLIHVVQVGAGHTDGDCVVYFPSQRVVAAGDLFFNGYYPVVDAASGGSFVAWIETLDRVLALGPSRIVPGHGPVAETAELKAFQGYLRDLLIEVSKLRAQGKSRDAVVKELRLPIHEARMKNLYSYSSLAQNAADAYDELEAGGKLPEWPGVGVEAVDGEPGEGETGDAEKANEPGGAEARGAGVTGEAGAAGEPAGGPESAN